MNLLGIVTTPCIFKGSIEDEKSNRKLTTRYGIGVAHVSDLSFLSRWCSILQGVALSEGKQRKWVCNIHLAGFVETCRNLPAKSTPSKMENIGVRLSVSIFLAVFLGGSGLDPGGNHIQVPSDSVHHRISFEDARIKTIKAMAKILWNPFNR